jgi:hypothetical protein
MAALALVAAACGGGGDDDATEDTVSLEEAEPIVDIAPCDLIDESDASALAGAEVGEAESTTEDDGTTTCDFAFADEEVADETGSAIAASLSIGPGDSDDVPGGSAVARTLSMGDAGAVEEDDDKVRVVYIVREVVVRVEVVPGDGEIDDELIDEVVEFAETTEAPVTEAVTGEPFVPRTTTTEFVDDDVPAGDEEIEIDGSPVTLRVERAGGQSNATFEAEDGDIVFLEITSATRAPVESSDCLVVRILDPNDSSINSNCAREDGSAFIDRTELSLDGTYQVLFDPDGPVTGSVQVSLTSVTDEEGDIEIDGATETLTVGDFGGVSRFEFRAEAGDAVFVGLPAATRDDPETTDCLVVRILDPDGNSINSNCAREDGGAFIDRTELPTAGTYAILFDPDGRSTGSVDVQLTAAD